ncbi:hypothetical protein BDA96_01G215400 [Sorghum bicolor]|uniref:Uncharacterized protein n=1 Tax=Sorghum bicolor TaxID=4558 RepID=A0A921S0G1_SORBI|nr:hypothetical protein BDA96_01G215400 [Sorghum bicolor]
MLCNERTCFHGTGAQHWNQLTEMLTDEGNSRTHSCASVIKQYNLQSLAEKHGKMLAQLVLRWGL